jgi:hypothetical protein
MSIESLLKLNHESRRWKRPTQVRPEPLLLVSKRSYRDDLVVQRPFRYGVSVRKIASASAR